MTDTLTGPFYELNNRDGEYVRFCRAWIKAWKAVDSTPESTVLQKAAMENFVECVVAYIQVHKEDRDEQHEDVASAIATIQFDDDSLDSETLTELENEFYSLLVQKLLDVHSPNPVPKEDTDSEVMQMRKKLLGLL